MESHRAQDVVAAQFPAPIVFDLTIAIFVKIAIASSLSAVNYGRRWIASRGMLCWWPVESSTVGRVAPLWPH